MPDHADLIENTELAFSDFLRDRHKAGLTYHEILRIQMTQLEHTLLQLEAELFIRSPDAPE